MKNILSLCQNGFLIPTGRGLLLLLLIIIIIIIIILLLFIIIIIRNCARFLFFGSFNRMQVILLLLLLLLLLLCQFTPRMETYSSSIMLKTLSKIIILEKHNLFKIIKNIFSIYYLVFACI